MLSFAIDLPYATTDVRPATQCSVAPCFSKPDMPLMFFENEAADGSRNTNLARHAHQLSAASHLLTIMHQPLDASWSSGTVSVIERPAFIRPSAQPGIDPSVREFAGAFGALNELSVMGENWDGYGALRIHETTSANARRILVVLMEGVHAPDLTPNPNGTISMEWESHNGFAHLEVGVSRFSFYLKAEDEAVRIDGSPVKFPRDIGPLIAELLFERSPAAKLV